MNIRGIVRNHICRFNDYISRVTALPYVWLLQRNHDLPSLDLLKIVDNETNIDPPIMDKICLAPYLGQKGYDDHDDFSPFMRLARSMHPRIVVELGTGYGNLTANICKQCPEAKVYTVNAPAEEQTGSFDTYRLSRETIGHVYRDHGFADRVVQIYKNTLDLELSEYLDGPVVDLGIIDACHNTDYVINDFKKILPFISGNGAVLFHDTNPSLKIHLWGSYLACMKLRKQGFDIRHISDTWWAVWFDQWEC
jgi:predicted O-methyltransferase YrrM